MKERYLKVLVLTIAGAVFSLSAFGILFCSQVFMDFGGASAHNNHCAPNHSSHCAMDFTSHVGVWHSFTQTVLSSGIISLLDGLFLALSALLLKICVTYLPAIKTAVFLRQRWRYKLNNFLLKYFSAGLAEPKLFA